MNFHEANSFNLEKFVEKCHQRILMMNSKSLQPALQNGILYVSTDNIHRNQWPLEIQISKMQHDIPISNNIIKNTRYQGDLWHAKIQSKRIHFTPFRQIRLYGAYNTTSKCIKSPTSTSQTKFGNSSTVRNSQKYVFRSRHRKHKNSSSITWSPAPRGFAVTLLQHR
jgi:hypothetical protein